MATRHPASPDRKGAVPIDETPAGRMADQIARDIASLDGPLLPSVRALVERYRVSRTTVIRACRLLADRGAVEFRQGGRMRIAGAGSSEEKNETASRQQSDETVYEYLFDSIRKGMLRAGSQLPRALSYANRFGVAKSTVLRAYNRLVAENLVNRTGRRWFVGPRLQPSAGSDFSAPPVIVVIDGGPEHLTSIASTTLTERFFQTFVAEAEGAGVQLIAFRAHLDKWQEEGKHAFEERVNSLGDRLRGCLVACNSDSVRELPHLLDDIHRRGIPVVWLDSRNDDLEREYDQRYLTRCYFSEANGVRAALDALSALGHTSATCVSPFGPFDGWRLHRLDLLRRTASTMENMVIREAISPGNLFDAADDERFPRVLYTLMLKSYPFVEEVLRELSMCPAPPPNQQSSHTRNDELVGAWLAFLHRLPARIAAEHEIPQFVNDAVAVLRAQRDTSRWNEVAGRATLLNLTGPMMSALAQGSTTAIIVPNDQDALRLHRWLVMARIDVPRELSVIAFDNHQYLSLVPVTTIDFGLGHLGYMAFQGIMQGVATGRDRRGCIGSRARLVHRGSIGRPRSTDFLAPWMYPHRV